ncbi:hypothetical protein VDGD_03668 [Verticillium dahliae]|nr:hypothetical protein VDGD_03668 [Verticillium dahliae]
MSFSSLFEYLLTPSMEVIFFGIIVVLLVPLVLHTVLMGNPDHTNLPVVMLAGPMGAGKTALASLLERGTAPSETHTSYEPKLVELKAVKDAKDAFRAHDDKTPLGKATTASFSLLDTPGHPKLRRHALDKIRPNINEHQYKAVVFVVDAAALGDQPVLADAAEYLYDVLLTLQRRFIAKNKFRGPDEKRRGNQLRPVLVAANKADLFTALPATVVRSTLEAELARIRASRSKALLDSGVKEDDLGSEANDSWLGEYGSSKFAFDQLDEFDISVDVLGGNVTGQDGPSVDKWWQWIAYRM